MSGAHSVWLCDSSSFLKDSTWMAYKTVSCCRILEVWQSLSSFCPVSIPFIAKLAVFLLIRHSPKLVGLLYMSWGFTTLDKRVFHRSALFHLYFPQIFLRLYHLYPWLLNTWVRGSMSHKPNFFNKCLCSHTVGLLSRAHFLNSEFNFSAFYNLDRWEFSKLSNAGRFFLLNFLFLNLSCFSHIFTINNKNNTGHSFNTFLESLLS